MSTDVLFQRPGWSKKGHYPQPAAVVINFFYVFLIVKAGVTVFKNPFFRQEWFSRCEKPKQNDHEDNPVINGA